MLRRCRSQASSTPPYGEDYHIVAPSDLTRRYTGHDWDEAANHYFAPYRFYNPQQARWLTRDPSGMIDGANLYGYVNGNPAMKSDPSGLFGATAAILLFAAAAIGTWYIRCKNKARQIYD